MPARGAPWACLLTVTTIPALVAGVTVALATQVPTTMNDYFGPGTQPHEFSDPIYEVSFCSGCHGNFNADTEPLRPWAASMMGQSARDPIFLAALAIANQDAAFAGDLCLRCHAPAGWLKGRSTPTDGSALDPNDLQGVTCHVCHRMVRPTYVKGQSPPDDPNILANLDHLPPADPHSGQYIIDPRDRRRGPYELVDFFVHEWRASPFHNESEMCATCHDVSNPLFTRQPDDTYTLDPNSLDQPHGTHEKYDQFPAERTYSEWTLSDFAQGPVDVGGRFGGNLPAVSSCQDCHMPPTTGFGCFFGEERSDLGRHYFNGANTWVVQAVRNLYPDSETFLTDASVAASIARAEDMLRNASDLELTEVGSLLNVRVINWTGHKLPSGYPEGRRMWVNVRYFDAGDGLIDEYGAYDPNSATLNTTDTKVYEALLGPDEDVAALAGLPAGPGFHFALSNKWYFDNRIPPLGFDLSLAAQRQVAPVGYTYADGQNWDDTLFAIPPGARRAEVRVFFQLVSREYIEFLRDENLTDNTGQIAYDQWLLSGKSPPVEMDFAAIQLGCVGDLNGDDAIDLGDLSILLAHFGLTGVDPEDGDLDGDADVDLGDLSALLVVFGTACN